ncbi:helix-turn-helix domain-containing protein [Bifidobacterium sp. 82T24]|nr:AraC family transcriptional regulator [Bifidobacterium pluvialisilvae]MBW3087591.1 helix-turn-helix domain-containing protein [Bifidobacterium pluvialisilvae]
MDAVRESSETQAGSGALEVIVPDADASIRWSCHGYPNSLAKWHYHPQIEFHLIREGGGQFMAGDGLVPFEAGHVAMVGENLPHNWLSDIMPGERLPHRDVLCHVRPQTIRGLFPIFPETAVFERVLRRSRQAIVLSGESAATAGELLVAMGGHAPAQRVADLVAMLAVFEQAPADESRTVVTPNYDPDVAVGAESAINATIAYISSNLADASLERAARTASMSVSTFSRFFKNVAGIGFSDFVCQLRIGRACRLLTTTTMPIAKVRELSGYVNVSNFNRRFLARTGMTPSQYRRAYAR